MMRKVSTNIEFLVTKLYLVTQMSFEAALCTNGSQASKYNPVIKYNLVTRVYTVAFFVLLLTAPALAQNFGIDVQVERRDVTTNAPFNVIVTLQGGEISQLTAPESPENLVIDPNGQSVQQSTSIQVINGQISQMSKQVYIFKAHATKEGKVTIPPFHALISGKEFESQSIELEVTAGSGALKLNTPNPTQHPKWDKKTQTNPPAATGADKKNPTLEDIVYISCDVDRNEVYQGELVMLRLQLGNLVMQGMRNSISGARSMPAPPATEGFYRGPDNLKNNETFKVGDYDYNGVQYYIPLYATHEGDFEIGPWVWEGVVMGPVQGFGLQQQMVHKESEVAKIKVKPLPDRPAGFSGAVGTYEIKIKLKDSTLSQGVPTDLVITVSGYGNPDAIGALELPALPWADIADPEIATARPDANDWSLANRTFTYTLTPNSVGKFDFPSMSFIYFDPKSEHYETINTDAFKVLVAESTESNQLVTMGGQTQPKTAASQRINLGKLAPPIREVGRLRPVTSGGGVANTVAVIFPVAAYACCFAFLHRKRRYEEDPRHTRHIFARKRSRERLKGLEEHADPAELLFKTVTAFVADRFSIPAEGLTSADVQKLLRERGVSKTLTDTFVQVLRACERQRFAGGALSASEVSALREAAEGALNDLEALTEKRGRT